MSLEMLMQLQKDRLTPGTPTGKYNSKWDGHFNEHLTQEQNLVALKTALW